MAYGNAPVAAVGIVFKANMFITFLQMGLANGVQPLLGYNFGSGDTKRFHGIESYTKKLLPIHRHRRDSPVLHLPPPDHPDVH